MAAEASPKADETVKVSFRRLSGSDISFPSVKPKSYTRNTIY